MPRKTIFAACFAFAAALAHDARSASVAVSVKPVHSLVAGVMAGVGDPWLILQGPASPHTYQLRPSEATLLSEADLIVWVGEAMETFLERPIENLGSNASVVSLHESAGIRLLPAREGGIWEDHESEVHVDEHDEHGHDHGEYDMHVWLDPANARHIVQTVAEALSELDPDHAAAYQSNAAAMQERIDKLELSLDERLAPIQELAFVVFHDAYQYFELAFGLNALGAVAVDPARPPGAKRLSELREALIEHDVRCVFTEPQFKPDLIHTVAVGTNVRTASIDPTGFDIDPGPDAWFMVMENLADAIVGCLEPT